MEKHLLNLALEEIDGRPPYNLGLQKVKNTNLLNIFVTKKHEDSHVEFSTISTAFSFLIVTTNNKSLKIQLPSLKKQVNQALSQHHCH